MKPSLAGVLFIASYFFCVFNAEKGNVPYPYDVLLVTVFSTGLVDVVLATFSLIRALLRFRIVRSFLLYSFVVTVLIIIGRQTSLSSFDFEDISGDELPIAAAIESSMLPDSAAIESSMLPDSAAIESSTFPNSTVIVSSMLPDSAAIESSTFPNSTVIVSSTLPVSTAIESSPLVLHELDASCDIKLGGLCLDPTFVYTIVDYDEFLIASNNEARNVVEWIMDEAAASTRERLLVWHRHMAAITSKLKGGPNPVFIERWVDVTTYVQNLPTHPDPLDIYQKVWRTLTAYHMLKRDMVTRDATLQGLE